MPMEDALAANTEAVNNLNANFARFFKGGGAAVTATTTGKAGAKVKTYKPAEVKAIAMKVMAEKGKPAAVKLIADHGASSLAELDADKYNEFVDACNALLASQTETEDEDDDKL